MAYPVFIQDECMIPAVAAFTGRPEQVVRKVWEKAKKKGYSPVLDVPGDMPESKFCPSCGIRARKDATVCVMCGHLYSGDDE